MSETQNHIIEVIKSLRRTPGMVLSGESFSYNTYVSFLEGFMAGLNIFSQRSLERSLSSWFQHLVELKAPNMVWFAHFDLVHSDMNEAEKKEALLDTLEEFFHDQADKLFSGIVPT